VSPGSLHCVARQADENRSHPPILDEPDSLGQRETRRIAISRPILGQQVVDQSLADRGLERLSSQTAPPVAWMTEYLEVRDLARPALIAGHRNDPFLHAQTEDSRVGPDASFLPFRRRDIPQ
jgi:hypothetical protein